MDKKQVVKHIKEGRLWFTKNEQGSTVWGAGDMILPIEVEFVAGEKPVKNNVNQY